jgi:hypothetical protein
MALVAPSANKIVEIAAVRGLSEALRAITQAVWPVQTVRDAARAGFSS